MPEPKPQYIANLLISFGTNPEPRRLRDVIVACLKSKLPNLSEERVWDWVEEFEADVARELFEKASNSLEDAVVLPFELMSEDDEHYIHFNETPGLELLRGLQSGSPQRFEEFCAEVLTKFGGTRNITASSHDGGIDFWSNDILLNNLPYKSTVGSRVLVVGQAKRYQDGNHISELQLREFVGASVRKVAELKRTRSEYIGILQPTILAFWTTSDFHGSAKDFARDLGIWYLNGPALCQLATHLGINSF